MITFEDVQKKYSQSYDVIDECAEVVNRDNPFDTFDYAPWIRIPILARWLYGSSQESLKGFRSTAKGFLDSQDSTHTDRTSSLDNIKTWDYVLSEKVCTFRDRLLMIFGTKDEKLMEALRE